jgi:anthranilate phosphoribosyltransferase
VIAEQAYDLTLHIRRCVSGDDLTANEMESTVSAIAAGVTSPAQTAALLVALAIKGESAGEIVGAARALRGMAVPMSVQRRPLMDVCGTGGDESGSFNISTAAAFVVAGAGVAVAKHGNRAVTGRCGSADVMESLGVRLDAPRLFSSQCLEHNGIVFLFAQAHHPALRSIAPIRREIGVRTLFNLIGPLVNPAQPCRQMIGVANKRALWPVVEALAVLGVQRCAAVRAEDGMDEVSLFAPTRVVEWTGTAVKDYVLHAQDFGLPRTRPHDVHGSDSEANAAIMRAILAGERGARRNTVVANAALALTIAGMAKSLREGVEQAQASIDSGSARAKLDALVRATGR